MGSPWRGKPAAAIGSPPGVELHGSRKLTGQPFRFGWPGHEVGTIASAVLPNGAFNMWWAVVQSFGES